MKPTVGRTVHFAGPRGPEAAIITAVWSDTCVNLHVMHPMGGTEDVESAVLIGSGIPEHAGQWSWPERV